MPFSIYMDMLIKKAAFCSVIQSITLDYRHKAFYSQNIYQRFVNMSNLNHAILVKSKWLQKIKVKTYPKKVVQELLYINGPTHLIVILYKQDYLKM